jgi:hypothetical protein
MSDIKGLRDACFCIFYIFFSEFLALFYPLFINLYTIVGRKMGQKYIKDYVFIPIRFNYRNFYFYLKKLKFG